MARMTATDMVRIVRKNVGSPDTSELTDADVLRCLNNAQEDVAAAFRPPELQTSTAITTTSGTGEYELSVSDQLIILSCVDTTNESQLYHIDQMTYDMLTQGTTTSGAPDFWYEYGTGTNGRAQIRFYPQPDGAYSITVTYITTPTEMALSPAATSPGLPRIYDSNVIERACLWAQVLQGEADSRQLKRTQYDALKHRLPVEIPWPLPTVLFDGIRGEN